MKIGEIEVGKEYAVHDYLKTKTIGPRAASRPRRVRVVEIVTETRKGRSWGAQARGVRVPRVEFLDEPEDSYGRIGRQPQGDVANVEAKRFLGPWETVIDEYTAARDRNAEAEAMLGEIERRLQALGIQTARPIGGITTAGFEVRGSAALAILEWAERGKPS